MPYQTSLKEFGHLGQNSRTWQLRAIELLAAGYYCKQIADELKISRSTVDSFLKRLEKRHFICKQSNMKSYPVFYDFLTKVEDVRNAIVGNNNSAISRIPGGKSFSGLSNLFSLHNCRFMFKFEGRQPQAGYTKKWGIHDGFKGGPVFEWSNIPFVHVRSNKRMLTMYVRNTDVGSVSERWEKARTYALEVARSFEFEHGIRITGWNAGKPDVVLEDEKLSGPFINGLGLRQASKWIPMVRVTTDHSHPNKLEADGGETVEAMSNIQDVLSGRIKAMLSQHTAAVNLQQTALERLQSQNELTNTRLEFIQTMLEKQGESIALLSTVLANLNTSRDGA